MTFSASFVPLQPGSWLMSILAAFGAVPSNFTVPVTVAAVAGSIGVAAAVGAGVVSAGALLDCSVFSFLLQAVNMRATITSRANVIIARYIFLRFILFSLLKLLISRVG